MKLQDMIDSKLAYDNALAHAHDMTYAGTKKELLAAWNAVSKVVAGIVKQGTTPAELDVQLGVWRGL